MPPPDHAAPRLRPARVDEFDRLIAVENDAEAALIEAAVPLPAAYPTMSHAALARSLAAGWLVVAVDGEDRPLGFLAGEERDGGLLITEIDVERRRQGGGVGRALMAHALAAARRAALWGAMLTADRLVPFNRRFYETLGFTACTTDPPAPLRATLAREIALGLDPDRRIAMVLRFA
ncbi:MAG: GNAT family N-acetyltransferase [Alphaproteobacteria bacterium]